MDSEETTGDDPRAGMRKLGDARELRALAHPLRIALLELIGLNGPTTATEAAKVIGGSPANAAYHLRTLAKYGYIVEAEGGAGRERPWKIGSVALNIDSNDPDPAVAHAAGALADVFTERWLNRARQYQADRAKYPAEIRQVSGSSHFVLFGTAAEAEQIQNEILQIMMRYMDRIADPALRPAGAGAFEMVLATHPIDLTTPTDSEG